MYELVRVCNGFLCIMSVTYDGAVLQYVKYPSIFCRYFEILYMIYELF